MSYAEFIKETDEKIIKAINTHNKLIFLMSVDLGESDVKSAEKYYVAKGCKFEYRLCPRKLYDIIISWRL